MRMVLCRFRMCMKIVGKSHQGSSYMNDTSTQEDTHEKWIVISGEGRDN